MTVMLMTLAVVGFVERGLLHIIRGSVHDGEEGHDLRREPWRRVDVTARQ